MTTLPSRDKLENRVSSGVPEGHKDRARGRESESILIKEAVDCKDYVALVVDELGKNKKSAK